MARLAFKDELLDAQLLRTLGTAAAGGADIGECLTTASRVTSKDLSSWHQAWTQTATRVRSQADAYQERGELASARSAYLRSSNYFRTAGVMLTASPLDRRLIDSHRRHTEAFRAGAALLPNPPEVVAIPFENTTLPGYLFTPHADTLRRPTVVLTGGYDGTAEELYFLTGHAALERGYNVLAFDGPGQGAALLDQGLALRPDWEQVIGPVVDFLIARPEVAPDSIALIGLSLGAHLAPRAASAEHRLAACVADCGSFDLFEAALSRIPSTLRDGWLAGRPLQTAVLERILGVLASKPTAGWALRRGQLVHGVNSPSAYLQALREYSLKTHAQNIKCPTLVCNADGDDIGASAPEFYNALTCTKEFVSFRGADGAGDHCEAGARSLFHERTFGWLDNVLDHQCVSAA